MSEPFNLDALRDWLRYANQGDIDDVIGRLSDNEADRLRSALGVPAPVRVVPKKPKRFTAKVRP